MPADASASDDHDVIPDTFVRNGQIAVRAIEPAPDRLPLLELPLHRVDGLEHQRVHGDGHNGAREDQGVLVRRDQPRAKSTLAEDERELANLAPAGCDDE